MARIRSTKPEFWSNEQVMRCSRDARLFFIGLWNFCDDEGRHPLSPMQLKALIFPGDDLTSANVRGLIDELSSNGLLLTYEVDGKEYVAVTGWKHQKIDRPQPAKCPPPPQGAALVVEHSTNDRDGAQKGAQRGKEDTKQPAQHPTAAREPAAAPRSRIDYDRIESLCRQAAGVEDSPSPSLKNLAPILGLLEKGYDLERDILPVLKAKRAAGKQGRSWGYYSAAIEDSVRAVAAISPRPPTVGAAPPSREEEWLQRLDFLAEKGQWPEAIWGAPPGRQFCEIPADFIAKHRPNLSSRYRREEVA